jgi:hypothetical protein
MRDALLIPANDSQAVQRVQVPDNLTERGYGIDTANGGGGYLIGVHEWSPGTDPNGSRSLPPTVDGKPYNHRASNQECNVSRDDMAHFYGDVVFVADDPATLEDMASRLEALAEWEARALEQLHEVGTQGNDEAEEAHYGFQL